MDIDAYNGRMLRLTRPASGAIWTVTDSVLVSDIATKLGAGVTRSFTFALDRKNERLYIAPFSVSSTSIDRLIRCPSAGYSPASCVAVGGAARRQRGSGGQVPGTDPRQR